MIKTDRYFINLDDGCVVAWTDEIENNYKFKEISGRIAMAIEKGKISWQDVVRQINAKLSPETLDEMLEKKMRMNVRSASQLNLEEQALNDMTQQSGKGNPYDIVLPDNASGEEKDKSNEAMRKRRESEKAKKEAKAREEAEAKAREEAEAKAREEAEKRAASALAEDDGEGAAPGGGEGGGVNL